MVALVFREIAAQVRCFNLGERHLQGCLESFKSVAVIIESFWGTPLNLLGLYEGSDEIRIRFYTYRLRLGESAFQDFAQASHLVAAKEWLHLNRDGIDSCSMHVSLVSVAV